MRSVGVEFVDGRIAGMLTDFNRLERGKVLEQRIRGARRENLVPRIAKQLEQP